jgi:hypothetical protein
MTYTYKLARRLARLRTLPALLIPILAACSAGQPTDPSSTNDSGDTSTDQSALSHGAAQGNDDARRIPAGIVAFGTTAR